ncbi:hypothetical protein ACK3HF_20270, partial [Enterobacter kobei]|uniref:hypothetical protein n=1 Tax=Enterobacter kobei TaxID=208224 RepID=UPI0039177AB9
WRFFFRLNAFIPVDVTKQAECFTGLPQATFRFRPAPCPVPRQNRAFFLRLSRHLAENTQVSEHEYFDFCYLTETAAANYSRGIRATEVSE